MIGAAASRNGGPYDVIVVGLGIHGAVCALEAARRGRRVLAIERDDFGGATSWASLRVLHGGLRYLQHADLPRFRESVRSRAWFFREFPDLVEPVACLMPLYGRGMRRRALMGPALAMNRLLRRAWSTHEELAAIPPSRLLGPQEVREAFPAVRDSGLRGGAVWHDGWMPAPQRVLIEVLRRAADAGATVLNYVEAVRVVTSAAGELEGIVVRDHPDGDTREVRAPIVINCAGPWAGWACPPVEMPEHWPTSRTLGFNLLLDRTLPASMTVAVTPPAGGQTYFLHRFGRRTFAGTFYVEGARGPAPTEKNVGRFLDDLRSAVPDFDARPSDVIRVLAGSLPGGGDGLRSLASRDLIGTWGRQTRGRGFYFAVGTKYTTAPAAAARVLARALGDAGPVGSGPAEAGATTSVRPVPNFEDFRSMALAEPERATALVRSIVEDEGPRSVEDLLLRRTDWGLAPQDGSEAAALLKDLGVSPAGRS